MRFRLTLGPIRWRAVAGWLLGLAALLAALGLADRAGYPTKDFTSDPSTVGDFEWWKGSVSLAGTALWFASAAVFTVASWASPIDRRFLRAMAVVSGGLGLDDSLRVHETILPVTFHISEHRAFFAYGLALAAVAWVFRHRLLAKHPVPAAAFALGMTASIASDVVLRGVNDKGVWFEDVPKAWALVALLAFALLEARDAVAARSAAG